MTIVVGTVVCIAENRAPGWTIGKVPFWRDSLMLLTAATFVLIVANDGNIHLWEALGFLLLHLLYISIVLLLPKLVSCGSWAVYPRARTTSATSVNGGARGVGALARGSMGDSLIHSGIDGSLNAGGVGGASLPPLVMPRLEPLQLGEIDAGADKRSRSSSGTSAISADAAGAVRTAAQSFVGLWGADANGNAAVQHLWGVGGNGGGNGGAAGGGGGNGRATMEGLDCPESRSPLARLLFVLELPLSLLRWLTIPSSDGEWDRRRRVWTTFTPPLAAVLFSCEYFGDVPTALGATLSDASRVPVWAVLLGGGVCVSLGVYLSSVDERPPRWLPLSVVLGFAMTIIWLDLVANEMIALIETIGHILDVSTSILGLTVIAIGNSVGDFVADTAAARDGTQNGARMAIAACFGSPVIMNIVSVGLSFSLRLLLTHGQPIYYEELSRLARLGYMLFYLTLLSHLLVFPLCGYRAPRIYALYLYAIYLSLISLSCIMEVSGPEGTFGGAWLCEGVFKRVFGPCPGGCE